MSQDGTENDNKPIVTNIDPAFTTLPYVSSPEKTLIWPKFFGVFYSAYWLYVNIRWGVHTGYLVTLAIFIILTVGVFMNSRICSALLAAFVALDMITKIRANGVGFGEILDFMILYMIIQGTVAMFRLHKSPKTPNKASNNDAL